MRDTNTLTKVSYVLENLFFGLLAIQIYKNNQLLFVNFLSLNYEISLNVLSIISFVLMSFGIIITMKHRRNSFSTFINVISPFVAYSLIAYFEYYGIWISVLLIVSAIVSIVYIKMTRKYANSKISETNKSFSRKRYCFLGTRTITTIICSIFVFILVGTSVTGLSLNRPNDKAVDTSKSFTEYLDENVESLDLLEESRWKKLSNQNKIDVLQDVCNAERLRLGIKSPLFIKTRILENNLLGTYINSSKTIIINYKLLEKGTPEEILECLTHECFHSFQYELVDLYDSLSDEQKKLYIFQFVQDYKNEFAQYKNGYCSDFNEYYGQSIEENSRSYASYAPDIYLERAEKHHKER